MFYSISVIRIPVIPEEHSFLIVPSRKWTQAPAAPLFFRIGTERIYQEYISTAQSCLACIFMLDTLIPFVWIVVTPHWSQNHIGIQCIHLLRSAISPEVATQSNGKTLSTIPTNTNTMEHIHNFAICVNEI